MYVRDKRSPTPKSEAVSRVMSANRAKDTKPEILLRKALWHAGHRGYRLHHRIRIGKAIRRLLSTSNPKSEIQNPKSFVRPDISFVGKRVAIFVNGCFWHRCPKCRYALPKNNSAFWQAKFDRNVARDELKRKDLKALGWKVITVWECDLKKRLIPTLNHILKSLR